MSEQHIKYLKRCVENITSEMHGILDFAESRKRDLTPGENKEYHSLDEKLDDLQHELKIAREQRDRPVPLFMQDGTYRDGEFIPYETRNDTRGNIMENRIDENKTD